VAYTLTNLSPGAITQLRNYGKTRYHGLVRLPLQFRIHSQPLVFVMRKPDENRIMRAPPSAIVAFVIIRLAASQSAIPACVVRVPSASSAAQPALPNEAADRSLPR